MPPSQICPLHPAFALVLLFSLLAYLFFTPPKADSKFDLSHCLSYLLGLAQPLGTLKVVSFVFLDLLISRLLTVSHTSPFHQRSFQRALHFEVKNAAPIHHDVGVPTRLGCILLTRSHLRVCVCVGYHL